MTDTVQIDFTRPLPVFPLTEVVLFPHTVHPLHIFEPRYRQLVNDSLDSSGQIAMASYALPDDAAGEFLDGPPLRPAVCLGRILEHDRLPDGRQNILLQGICRAQITQIHEPEDERHYHLATLEPTISEQDETPEMTSHRYRLRQSLRQDIMEHVRNIDAVRKWVDRDDLPTDTVVDLLAFALVSNPELKYTLLADDSPIRRAELVAGEIDHVRTLLSVAVRQGNDRWPKGMSWN